MCSMAPCPCTEALLLWCLCRSSAGQARLTKFTVLPIASVSATRWINAIESALPGHLGFKKERAGLSVQTSPAQWAREAIHAGVGGVSDRKKHSD